MEQAISNIDDQASINKEDLCGCTQEVLDSEKAAQALRIYNKRSGTNHTISDVRDNAEIRGDVFKFMRKEKIFEFSVEAAQVVAIILDEVEDTLSYRGDLLRRGHDEIADDDLTTPFSFVNDDDEYGFHGI